MRLFRGGAAAAAEKGSMRSYCIFQDLAGRSQVALRVTTGEDGGMAPSIPSSSVR